MRKYAIIFCLLSTIFLLNGCVQIRVPVVSISTSLPATTVTTTPMPLVLVITATPFEPLLTESSVNPTPVEAYSTPTPAPVNASITISQIQILGNGQAVIQWNASGDFPYGFQILLSPINQTPTYGVDSSTYVSDPSARSALIGGQVGQAYFLRVCRFTGTTCDVYSNVGIFSFTWATSTPYPYYPPNYPTAWWPNAYNSLGTPIPSSSSIAITSITDAGTGKARINWNAYGTFSQGFRIVYSYADNPPILGQDSYYSVSGGATRSAYVDGLPGYTYYYRICRTTGSTCDIYSNTYVFKFAGTLPTNTPSVTRTPTATATPSISPTPTQTFTPSQTSTQTFTPSVTPSSTPDLSTITNLSAVDTSNGEAKLSWNASGSFPNGFKILLSSTNNPPQESDLFQIANGGVRNVAISGDVGATYHIAICKVVGSTCGVTSSVLDFTFGKINFNMTSILDAESGLATVQWSPIGTFPYGFKVLYAAGTYPVEGTSLYVMQSNPDGTSANVTGTPGTTYDFKVCGVDSSGNCTVSSQVTVEFTFAQITVTSVTLPESGTAHLSWTTAGEFSYGTLWLFSAVSDPLSDPASTSGVAGAPSGPIGSGSVDISVAPTTSGTKYYFRLCQAVSGGTCSAIYSDVYTYTVP